MYSTLDMLGDVGGFRDIISLFFGLLAGLYVPNAFTAAAVRRVYAIPANEESNIQNMKDLEVLKRQNSVSD